MAEPEISPEEFATWTPVSEAVSALAEVYSSGLMARSTIVDRLAAGLLFAATDTYITYSNGRETHRGGPARIPAGYWNGSHKSFQHEFWTNGHVEFDLSESRYSTAKTTSCFDLRFHPEGLAKIIPVVTKSGEEPVSPSGGQLSDSEGTSVSQPKKPLSQADLDKFGKLLLGLYPEVTEAFARRAASAMFTDSAISRERIRELLPPRRPGRPASGGKGRG
jgi:hypothetical protein